MNTSKTFHGVITRETPQAIFFDAITFRKWFPKSKIEIKEITQRRVVPRQAQIVVPAWLLKKKGLEDAI